ncbi:MAG: hypothetical protein ACXIVE_11280 [Salinarimonas sp.]
MIDLITTGDFHNAGEIIATDLLIGQFGGSFGDTGIMHALAAPGGSIFVGTNGSWNPGGAFLFTLGDADFTAGASLTISSAVALRIVGEGARVRGAGRGVSIFTPASARTIRSVRDRAGIVIRTAPSACGNRCRSAGSVPMYHGQGAAAR